MVLTYFINYLLALHSIGLSVKLSNLSFRSSLILMPVSILIKSATIPHIYNEIGQCNKIWAVLLQESVHMAQLLNSPVGCDLNLMI